MSKLLISVLLLCAASTAVPTYAKNQPVAVTLLIDDSYPPYTFVEQGQLQGFYVDLIQLAIKQLAPEYQITLEPMPWKRGLQRLKVGQSFAIVPPYRHLEQRPYIWPYSEPLLQEQTVVFCHKGIDIKALQQDVEGWQGPAYDIGINAGYLIFNDSLYQAQQLKKISIKENKSTRANILKLLQHRLDCYVNDKLSTEWEMKKLSTEMPALDLSDIYIADVILSPTAHIGYVKNSATRFPFKADFVAKMDKALASISSQQRQQLLNKYLKNVDLPLQ